MPNGLIFMDEVVKNLLVFINGCFHWFARRGVNNRIYLIKNWDLWLLRATELEK